MPRARAHVPRRGPARAILPPARRRGLLRPPPLPAGDVFALLADDRDPLADLDLLALAGEDLQQDAARVRLDLLRDLVRVELVERLALLDRVPFGLEPADDRAGLHALPEPRQAHISSQVVPLL